MTDSFQNIYHSLLIVTSSSYLKLYTFKRWRTLLNNTKIDHVCSKNVIARNTTFLCITQVTNTIELSLRLHISFFLAFSFSPSLFVTKANPALFQIPNHPFNMWIWEGGSDVLCALRGPLYDRSTSHNVSAVTRQVATTGPSPVSKRASFRTIPLQYRPQPVEIVLLNVAALYILREQKQDRPVT
jgi:hypothetical protein